jgi:hypothetical protein
VSARAAHVGVESPRHGRNPRAVCGGQKTTALVVAVARIGDAWSETDPGSVTVALGRA